MDKDPLSFLAGEDSSSSEDEDEGQTIKGKKSLKDSSYYTSNATSNDVSNKLPSPTTLFSSVKKPQFLQMHLSTQVDWDSLAKSIDSEETPPTSDNQFNTVPPPAELRPSHDDEVDPRAEISSKPVKYAVSSNAGVDPKLLTVSSNTSLSGDLKSHDNKRPASNADDDDNEIPAKKKSKGESFKEKEKRKRDLGMSSRGKSFVEEEKRILREQHNS